MAGARVLVVRIRVLLVRIRVLVLVRLQVRLWRLWCSFTNDLR